MATIAERVVVESCCLHWAHLPSSKIRSFPEEGPGLGVEIRLALESPVKASAGGGRAVKEQGQRGKVPAVPSGLMLSM